MKMNELITNLQEQFTFAKFKLPMLAAAILAPCLEFFKEFIFNDWKFMAFMAVFIVLDTITGVVKAWKRGTVSSQGFTGVMIKVFVYGAFVIVLHGLESFSEKAAVQMAFDWVGTLGYAAVLVREAISIIENLGAIKKGLIPEWILAKLKDFDQDGNVNGN